MDRVHYCCLYHFTNGKQTKSSTPCNHHVPLGVINPLPSTFPRQRPPPPEPMQAPVQQRHPHFHTHDLNQIENKMSLPKRLTYPRVYVQKLTGKGCQNMNIVAVQQAFAKGKDFQEIFILFRYLARVTSFKNETELASSIASFARKNDISQQIINDPPAQFYFSKSQFTNYLIQLGFEDRQALQMWSIAYNQARFIAKPSQNSSKLKQEVVSMRAFVYNYKKFYLQQMESFKNCLSEAALRQRMIDLRLFLEPWFTRNIIFKDNHMKWQEVQLGLCGQLKVLGQQELSTKVLEQIQLRNRTWLFMRTLAKLLYEVTDQKNIGLAIFNQRATNFISKNTINLDNFVKLVQSFEQYYLSPTSGKTREDIFPVTDLLQFAKGRFPEQLPSLMVCMRGIFKYMYFFRKAQQLTLNRQTLNLDCSQLVKIDCGVLQEFLAFRRGQTDRLMEMVGSICAEVNDVVEGRPQISGHKSFLNQCNYLAQATLKLVKRCDFSVFYRMNQLRQVFFEGDQANIPRLRSILQDQDSQHLQTRQSFWRTLFSFIEEDTVSANDISERQQPVEKNYEEALGAYHDLRKKLQGKLPSSIKPKEVKEEKSSASVLAKRIKSNKSSSANQQNPLEQQNSQKQQEHKHNCFNSAYCSLCDDICSTSVTSTIHKIDEMSSYLADLLRDI